MGIEIKAVITADFIHSSKMNAIERIELLNQLEALFQNMKHEFNLKSEIYRGDNFQCLLNKPTAALKVALRIKTFIRSWTFKGVSNMAEDFMVNYYTVDHKVAAQNPEVSSSIIDARIAIGIGPIDYFNANLAKSNGEAFHLSGQLLDAIKNKNQSLAIATKDAFAEELKASFV